MIDIKIMHDEITKEFDRFKSDSTSRDERMNYAENMIEDYFKERGEAPPSSILERLGTLILLDELTDRDRMKVRKTEYPFLSTDQEKRRNRGRRNITAAAEYGIDGVNYRIRTRDTNRRIREAFGI